MQTDAEVQAGVTATMLDYCELLDEKRLDEFVELFTDDVEFEEGGVAKGKPHVRNKVRKLLAMFQRLSHHLSNVRVTRTGPETAKASAYIYAWHHLNDGRVMEIWGRYLDEQRFEGGRWKIAKRTVQMQGARGFDDLALMRVPLQELPPR
ncbi:nuclear transport factor 2 family protein [Vitreimonas flagellata]|uniref:nuclear transport factor 2 family protein n=1 Tax=Vitreimonas flagellata TaxID=2560861 RepID=UPI00107530AA|nr:nuclear transport factor 2 family protein [Vitreimonas flagellata]